MEYKKWIQHNPRSGPSIPLRPSGCLGLLLSEEFVGRAVGDLELLPPPSHPPPAPRPPRPSAWKGWERLMVPWSFTFRAAMSDSRSECVGGPYFEACSTLRQVVQAQFTDCGILLPEFLCVTPTWSNGSSQKILRTRSSRSFLTEIPW